MKHKTKNAKGDHATLAYTGSFFSLLFLVGGCGWVGGGGWWGRGGGSFVTGLAWSAIGWAGPARHISPFDWQVIILSHLALAEAQKTQVNLQPPPPQLYSGS